MADSKIILKTRGAMIHRRAEISGSCNDDYFGARVSSLKTTSISSRISQARGAALSVLIVAVAVIVVLASLGVGAWKFANATSQRLRDVELHGRVLFSLDAYKTASSHYPTPAHPEETVEIDGIKFPSGGAAMLYQVVSGDGNDQILESASAPVVSDGDPANDDPLKVYSTVLPENRKQINGRWLIVDSFGHPVQYQKGGGPDAINKTYDVWLFGGDVSNVNRSDSAAKKDSGVIASWIRNFSLPPSKNPKDR